MYGLIDFSMHERPPNLKYQIIPHGRPHTWWQVVWIHVLYENSDNKSLTPYTTLKYHILPHMVASGMDDPNIKEYNNKGGGSLGRACTHEDILVILTPIGTRGNLISLNRSKKF